jgi:hypothetical protein
MKKLDADQVFNVFAIDEAQAVVSSQVSSKLDNPYIIFDKVIKGVEYYYIMEFMYTNRYGSQFDHIKPTVRARYFSVLMQYINKINISDISSLPTLREQLGEQSLSYALKQMIHVFEQLEMYEHCAVLLQYYNVFFSQNSCNSAI